MNTYKIFNYLNQYNKVRLHTPGHKGRMPYGLGKLDITEIGDGEIFPDQLITQAEQATANIYGVEHCRYLVGGSSMGLKAAIMSFDCDILIFDNAHKSIYDGVRLAKCKAFVFKLQHNKSSVTINQTEPNYQLRIPPCVDTVKQALEQYPSVRAVVLTSPDYFGQVVDKAVVDYIHSTERVVLLDAAHGAHFVFCNTLKKHDLVQNADIAIVSAHKTLNTLTQSSIAFCNNQFKNKLDFNIDLLSTTSPSYLLLASIEYGVWYAFNNRDKYEILKNRLLQLSKFNAIDTIDNKDYCRVVIDCKRFNMSGKQVWQYLYNGGIVGEMYTMEYLVLLFGIDNTIKDINRVKACLDKLENYSHKF